MPRIEADLSTVTAFFEAAPPATYECKVDSVEHGKSSGGFPQVKIISVIDDGSEEAGKKIFHTMVLGTKKGEPNKAALSELKQYFEAIAPQSANDPNPDTDELIGGRFLGEVVIEQYDRKNQDGTPKLTPSGEVEKGSSNRFKRVLPV